MMTIRAQKARSLELTREQQEIVIGSLLGDGYLTRTTCGYAFRVNHGFAQKAYVDWKYEKLQEFTNSGPKCYQKSYYFRTISHPFFAFLREEFYSNQVKIIPKRIDTLLTPLILAVWVMDDGAKDGAQLRINSQSFSQEENVRLIEILRANLGITATLNRDKNLFRLRIAAESMSCVRQLIAPYFIPSMLYKLSL